MGQKGLIQFPNSAVVAASKGLSLKRANSFMVKAKVYDFEQYARVVRAYSVAGMSFEDIANAGDSLGDEVERLEVNAAFQDSLQNKVGEVAEAGDGSQILAWQTRGERISVTHQLASPVTSGDEVVIASQGLAVTGNAQAETVEVLEGIKVSRVEPAEELENNRFLRFQPQEIKRAA